MPSDGVLCCSEVHFCTVHCREHAAPNIRVGEETTQQSRERRSESSASESDVITRAPVSSKTEMRSEKGTIKHSMHS